MIGRKLTGLLISLALPLTFAGSAAADFGDDVRDSISVPSAGDVRDNIETPETPQTPSLDDDGDDGSFDPPSHGDFSVIDDEARDRASQIRDEILSRLDG
jgi:hypothetical protein